LKIDGQIIYDSNTDFEPQVAQVKQWSL
jgi:hypothetical protein